MNPAKRVEKLRTRYERSLAASEARGLAYHEAVLGLIDGSGPDLRKLAEELGLLDLPAEQTLVASKPRPRRQRRHARTAGVLAAALLLAAALTVGALRVVHAPPFVQMVRVPRVMGLRDAVAIRRLRDAGLNVRVLRYRRSIPGRLSHRVLGVSHPAGTPPAGERLAKGSTVTLYVLVPHRRATKRPASSD